MLNLKENGYDSKDYSNDKILYVLKDITLHSHASYLELKNKFPYFLKINHKINKTENRKKMSSLKNLLFFCQFSEPNILYRTLK